MPVLLAGYLWLYLHRPFEYYHLLGALQVERLYMIATIVVWMVMPGKALPSNRLHTAFLYFVLAVFTCWFASPYPRELGEKVCEDLLKIAVFYVLLVTSIRDEKSLRRILVAYFVALTLYQAHSLFEFFNGRYEYRMGTVRLKGVDESFGDPNTFSATVLHALPFLLPLWLFPKGGRDRPLMLCYVGLSLVCILLTGSRRAFLGVFFLAFLVAMGTRHRWRWLALGLLLAPLGFCALPDNLRNRFLTIVDPSYGPHNATTSRNLRVQFFVLAMELWNKNPLTGVGPAAFGTAANTESKLQTHNLYAQAASELGTLGVAALLFMVFCFWRNAREARRLQYEHPWWDDGFPLRVVQTAWLAVVLLLFMGLGGHNLFRYNWLWFGAFQIVALQLLRRRAAAEAAGELLPGEELPETAGVRYGYAA